MRMFHIQWSNASFQSQGTVMEAGTRTLHRMDHKHIRACRMGCYDGRRGIAGIDSTVKLNKYDTETTYNPCRHYPSYGGTFIEHIRSEPEGKGRG